MSYETFFPLAMKTLKRKSSNFKTDLILSFWDCLHLGKKRNFKKKKKKKKVIKVILILFYFLIFSFTNVRVLFYFGL